MKPHVWTTIVAVWLWFVVGVGVALMVWVDPDAVNMALGAGIWAVLATMFCVWAWVDWWRAGRG